MCVCACYQNNVISNLNLFTYRYIYTYFIYYGKLLMSIIYFIDEFVFDVFELIFSARIRLIYRTCSWQVNQTIYKNHIYTYTVYIYLYKSIKWKQRWYVIGISIYIPVKYTLLFLSDIGFSLQSFVLWIDFEFRLYILYYVWNLELPCHQQQNPFLFFIDFLEGNAYLLVCMEEWSGRLLSKERFI